MRIGNWPLLLLALEHAIKHKAMYDQLKWSRECGAVRCLAGWIAFFAGWRDLPEDSNKDWVESPGYMDERFCHIEDAALLSLELDPEYYGTEVREDYDEGNGGRSPEMQQLANDLFGGGLSFEEILETVRDLAKADGVTPTPLIVEEMLAAGIVSEWDVF